MPYMTTSDGLKLAYNVDDYTDRWKRAPTIIMVHAAMSSSRRMYPLVPHFARWLKVVRMDIRGHGDSAVPTGDQVVDLARMTQDVRELMDHLGVRQAHFLGASGGGYLCQQMAIHDPERVLSLLLIASRPGFKDSKGAEWIPEMEKRGLRTFIADTIEDRLPLDTVDKGYVEWFLDEIARNDPAFVRRFVLYMTTQYWMSDMAKVKCPTLQIAPGDESIGNGSAYDDMKKLIADYELITYAGARHNIADYLADRCAVDCVAFLKRRFPGLIGG